MCMLNYYIYYWYSMCAKSSTGPHGYFIPKRGWVWEDFLPVMGTGIGIGMSLTLWGRVWRVKTRWEIPH
jgi:hypothetical protein